MKETTHAVEHAQAQTVGPHYYLLGWLTLAFVSVLHAHATGATRIIAAAFSRTELTNGGTYSPDTPLPAPTGLMAAAGNTQVAITWGLVPVASSYNVYRGRQARLRRRTASIAEQPSAVKRRHPSPAASQLQATQILV
jgi:hypothetical protein